MTPKFLAHDYTLFTGYENIINSFFQVVGDNLAIILVIFGLMYAIHFIVEQFRSAMPLDPEKYEKWRKTKYGRRWREREESNGDY